MITDITIGQYYKEDSFVHKLDPRMKIILTIMFIVMIFMKKKQLKNVYIKLVTYVIKDSLIGLRYGLITIFLF